MLKLSSPWVQYVNKLKALFIQDPDIDFDYNEATNVVTLKVRNASKADALTQLLPEKRTWGNVDLFIKVIPANVETNKVASLVTAFNGNPIFKFWKTVQVPMSNSMTYMVFEKEVVQYYEDNMADLYGMRNTLYQDIAKEVFDDIPGVYFCTDTKKAMRDEDDMPF